MSINPVSAIVDLGKGLISRIWPDPVKQAEEMRKLQEMEQRGDIAELNAHVQVMMGQLEINKAEAQHKSIFVAGWRPAVGWVCVTIIAFNYIGVYLLEYLAGIISTMPEPPQRMDMSDLWPVLLGMLGIGGMRSFDKKQRTQTDRIK